MGGGYNWEYVEATKYQADSNEAIALDSNEVDLQIAQEQSDAVIQQAKYDYDARIYEADKNYQIQMEALRVREKEAELTYKVDWKNAENDAIRAEASQTKADADYLEAEAEKDDVAYEHEEDMAKYDDGSSSYWYG
ncbi:MAG: hypothetical protein HYU99_06410 [Deltaproteobacteria bacterium]|nr:hypothetical protein [Deltaproteobacteria bacterium]